MGIEVIRGSSIRVMQPKATVKRTLPHGLVDRTMKIFRTFGEIPLPFFTTLYSDAYGEIFDAAALGFDTGVLGYLEELGTIRIDVTERGYMCRLRDHELMERKQTTQAARTKSITPTNGYRPTSVKKPSSINWLFDPEDIFLWSEKRGFRELLSMDPSRFTPALSPLEMAHQRDPRNVDREVFRIHQVMARYPTGIRLSDICTQININKRLFNTTSINSMVHEYPELFFVEEPREEGKDKVVYSGVTKTEPDLTGSEFEISSNGIKYLDMLSLFITKGLYQKTLLIIRAAGPEGLKLASWQQSIKSNFKTTQVSQYETILMNLDPLYLFRGLAFSRLIEIHSPHECKNDLRLKLPTYRIDFEEFLRQNKMLKAKAKFDDMMAHQNSLITYKRERFEYKSDGSTVSSTSSPCPSEVSY